MQNSKFLSKTISKGSEGKVEYYFQVPFLLQKRNSEVCRNAGITTQSFKSVSTPSTVIHQGQKRNFEVCGDAWITTQSSKSVSTSSTVILHFQKRNSKVCRDAKFKVFY